MGIRSNGGGSEGGSNFSALVKSHFDDLVLALWTSPLKKMFFMLGIAVTFKRVLLHTKVIPRQYLYTEHSNTVQSDLNEQITGPFGYQTFENWTHAHDLNTRHVQYGHPPLYLFLFLFSFVQD